MTLNRLAAAWLLGIVLAARLDPTLPFLLATLLPLAAGYVVWRTNVGARWALGLAICALLGAARFQLSDRPLGPYHIAQQNGRGVATIRGRIVGEPDRRDRRTGYRLAALARRVDEAWLPAEGVVLVWAPTYPAHEYGEVVVVTGVVEEPPVLDGFDYRAYLARKGIHSVVQRPRVETVSTGGGQPVRRRLLSVKGRARQALAAALPEPEASLATGILLGDAHGIASRVDEAFRVTNTTHVIAISGSNIALLITGLMLTTGRLLGERRAVLPILVAVALYTALVGADAAVVRAAIMGGLMVVGRHLGRPGHAATALLAAAWAMTAYRPAYLWDLGFQLSFAATLGLVLFSERFGVGIEGQLARRLGSTRARTAVRLLHEAVIVTLAAQLTTWPLIAYHTGQVSVVGLLANLLILPAQPLLMALGALTAMFGMASPPLGHAAGVVAWLPLAYTIRTVELVARLPLAAVIWPMPGHLVAAYYVALALAAAPGDWWQPLVRLQRHLVEFASDQAAAELAIRKWFSPIRARLLSPPAPPGSGCGSGRGRRWRWRASIGLAVACGLVWLGVLSQPDGLLHVYVLDVGQGDALLVVTPHGRRMLIDGGPSASAVLDQLGRRLPPWDRRLDVVVLTHPDADHVAGLPAVLARYRVALLLDPQLESATADAAAWQDALANEGAQVVRAAVGGRIVLDEAAGVAVAVEVLWPPADRLTGADAEMNDNSVVLRLTYGATAVLLTGDIEAPAERELVRRGAPLAAAVLKVSHHGSAGASTPEFLAAVSPAIAVIGVGADNDFGHPSPEMLARLGSVPVRRTDRDGAIELLLDGRAVWLR